jgi:ABC-2 type transport system ATP-binding protein
MTEQPAVRFDDVRKKYRRRERFALDGVGFAIEPGDVVGLLGPNGAGKTTLVKLLCGVTTATSGTVRVFGHDPLAADGRAKDGLAVVHQSTPLDNMLPVIDNIKIAAAFKGLRWRQVRRRVEAMLADFELTEVAGALAFTLSGGQQRRVQVIRALLDVPRLLVLDEPSAGLDVSGRRQVWDLIDKLVTEHGTTVLWTSHYVEEIERNCGRVMILHRGRVARYAPPGVLIDEFGRRSTTVTLPDPADRQRLYDLLRGADVELAERAQGIEITGPDAQPRLAGVVHLVQDAVERGATITFRAPSLEDAFLAQVAEAAPC